MQSAGLMAVHQTKLDRYSLLAALAERQVLDKLRAAAPVILPVAISTHGELCPGAVRVQEWLTAKYRERLVLEGDRDDGEKLEDLTAPFVASSAPPSLLPLARASLICSSLRACPLLSRTAAAQVRSAVMPDRRRLHPAARPRHGPAVPAPKEGLTTAQIGVTRILVLAILCEDDHDVIDVQPARLPRRSARLAAADASQACPLVSPPISRCV